MLRNKSWTNSINIDGMLGKFDVNITVERLLKYRCFLEKYNRKIVRRIQDLETKQYN